MAGLFDYKYHVPLVHVDTLDEDDEDLVTIVEKEKIDIEKKVVMVTDRFRTVEKLLYCDTLEDFLVQGKDSLGYGEDEEVYAVLEEDGTEVDEEEYFQYIPSRTRMIVMSRKETWSPTDTWQREMGSKYRRTLQVRMSTRENRARVTLSRNSNLKL